MKSSYCEYMEIFRISDSQLSKGVTNLGSCRWDYIDVLGSFAWFEKKDLICSS